MTIGVGVIGAGVMGAEHARIIGHEISGAHLVGVVDADLSRAQAAIQDVKGARALTQADMLINDPSVDAVLVSSPDDTHHPYVLAALALGKPVLCEKPLAVTSAQCLEIVEAEKRSGKQLVQVGFMRRFDPCYQEMKATIDSGELGDVRILHCQHRNQTTPRFFTGNMIITNSLVHELDVNRWLLNTEYNNALVVPCPAGEGGQCPDPMLYLFETVAGSLISAETFINCQYGYHVHAEAVCTKGTISLVNPTHTHIRRQRVEASSFPDIWVPRFREAYRNQTQAWINGILSGTPPEDGATAWDGLVATSLAEQLVGAMQTGERIQLILPPQ